MLSVQPVIEPAVKPPERYPSSPNPNLVMQQPYHRPTSPGFKPSANDTQLAHPIRKF